MFAEPKHPMTEVSRRDTEAILIECRNKFLGYLRKRLNSPQDAEDVFQDFCVKVLRNHASIKSGERLDAWLGITLRHTLTDHYRRQATRNRGAEAYANEAKILGPALEDFDEPACTQPELLGCAGPSQPGRVEEKDSGGLPGLRRGPLYAMRL